jgi:hypothetical protein
MKMFSVNKVKKEILNMIKIYYEHIGQIYIN